MRFLVDECTGPAVAQWLRTQGHEVFSVYEQARGLDDDSIIRKAGLENWIIITNDKEFGEKAYRKGKPTPGLVLLRLADERALQKIRTLQQLLASHGGRIADHYLVVTETKVRIVSL